VKLPLARHPVLLTYSPHNGGLFKFWDIKGGLTDNLVVEDKYPGVKLSAPDPDPSGNTIWSLIGFTLDPGNDLRPAQLWLLWRNHNYHHLYNCQFEFGSLATAWKSNWIKCDPTASKKNIAPDLVKSDNEDLVEKWLSFFFSPGRYSESVLETSLSIFQDATSTRLPSSQKATSLRQRLCAVVAANVSLRKYGDSDLDYDRFFTDTDAQWRNLYRIAESVNDGRIAPLSLAYDAYTDMAWITMADKCCAVRESGKIELLQHNVVSEIQELEDTCARLWTHRKVSTEDGESFTDMAVLLNAARTFRESLTPELVSDLNLAVEEDISTISEYITPTRIFDIFESIGFSEGVPNDVFDQLETRLDPLGGFNGLNNETFLAILELLSNKTNTVKSALRNTLFANLLISAGIQDYLTAQESLLLDLLTLAIFVEGELNQEDTKLPSFDASELYEQITPLLKICQRNLWLTRHSRRVPLEILGTDGHPNAKRRHSFTTTQETRIVSIFEDIFSKAVRPQPAVDKPSMYLITDQLAEIDEWSSGRDSITTEDGAIYLQCDLLSQGELDLAVDFQRFLPTTAWSSYVKGRLAIEIGHYDMATNYFRKASYSLSHGKALGNLVEMSAGLLSILEAECFYNGMPLYLHHITTLFESAKAYTEAAQFAHLTMEALQPHQPEPTNGFRSEVLSRLFTAELKTSRFSRAYDALVQIPDQALQRHSVTALVDAILNIKATNYGSQMAVKVLQSLPWAVNPHLFRHLDHHLVSLAKKQTSTGIKSSDWLLADGNVDYLNIIYAVRVAQKDYRGAVTVLFDRLRLVRKSGRARHDPQATGLRHVLLALINVMACVAPEDAYILADADEKDPRPQINGHDAGKEGQAPRRRRIIVTLEDLRKEYQQVLDRCSRIERGDFDYDVDGETEEDDGGDEGLLVDQSRLNLSSHGGAAGDAMEF
jgi:nuclear pore complex protein Nup160